MLLFSGTLWGKSDFDLNHIGIIQVLNMPMASITINNHEYTLTDQLAVLDNDEGLIGRRALREGLRVQFFLQDDKNPVIYQIKILSPLEPEDLN